MIAIYCLSRLTYVDRRLLYWQIANIAETVTSPKYIELFEVSNCFFGLLLIASDQLVIPVVQTEAPKRPATPTLDGFETQMVDAPLFTKQTSQEPSHSDVSIQFASLWLTAHVVGPTQVSCLSTAWLTPAHDRFLSNILLSVTMTGFLCSPVSLATHN